MDIALLRRRVAAHGLRMFAAREATPRKPSAAAALRESGILRILICRTSQSLGNTLLVTPLLQEIEAIWPGAEIDIVTRNAIAPEIFASYPSVRHIYCLPRYAARNPMQMLRQLQSVRGNRYDLAIDSDPRSRTGRALLSQSHARYKLGFIGKRKHSAVTHGIDIQTAPAHAGQIPVHLLRSALHRSHAEYPSLDLRLTAAEREQGREILARIVAQAGGGAKTGGTIGLFANATGRKLLPREWWRAFMPVIEGGYSDFSFVEIAPASGGSMLDSRYPVYYSSSVRKLSKVISAMSMLVCLDCGIMHLARASGTKTAAVFTVTDAAQWGPYGAGAYVVQGRDKTPEETAQNLLAAVPASQLRATS